MNMELRKELRDFINWQRHLNLLKDPLTIDYELAETYLESKEKQFSLQGVGCSLPDKETMISEMHKIVKVNYKHNTEIEKANFRIGWQEHYLWLNNRDK